MTRIFVRDEDGCSKTDAVEFIRQQQMAGVFGCTQEIGLLNNAWIDPQSRLFLLTGPTGSGKTTLLKKWLHTLQKKNWHDAEAVYLWSFYPPDLAHSVQDPVEEFFLHALHWFGGAEAARCPNLLQGEMLARLVQSHHTLLILDGLEILQSRSGSASGKLVDPRLATLLERLTTHNPGLCVAVSREPLVADFCSLPYLQQHNLDKLDLDAAVELLRYKGVEADDERLRQIAVDYGQNPLTLNLLGGYLGVWHAGDWRQMEKIPVLMDQQQDGRQARRILVANSTQLAGTAGEGLLYLLSTLYRPTHWDTLTALFGKRGWSLPGWLKKKQEDSFAKLIGVFVQQSQQKQYQATLQLRELGLLELSGRCFWLPQWVREAYQRQLRYDWPQAWKETNHRLMIFHTTLPTEPEMVETAPTTGWLPAGPFGMPAAQEPAPAADITEPLTVEIPAEPVVAEEPIHAEEPAPVVVEELIHEEEPVPVVVEEAIPEEEPAPAAEPVTAKVLPFPPRPVYTHNDLEDMGRLLEQVKHYQNSLQMLQIRTKKFQKHLKEFDNAVQSTQRPKVRNG